MWESQKSENVEQFERRTYDHISDQSSEAQKIEYMTSAVLMYYTLRNIVRVMNRTHCTQWGGQKRRYIKHIYRLTVYMDHEMKNNMCIVRNGWFSMRCRPIRVFPYYLNMGKKSQTFVRNAQKESVYNFHSQISDGCSQIQLS